MDPLIVKLLEDDEDENTHSRKDVEALTAALNRDIGRETSISQPTDPNEGSSSHGSSSLLIHEQTQIFSQEDATCQDQQEKEHLQPQEQRLSGMEILLHGSGAQSHHRHDGTPLKTDNLLLQHKRSEDDQQRQRPEHNSAELPKEKQTLSPKSPVEHPEEDIQKSQNCAGQHQQSKLQQLSNEKALTADQANKPVENQSTSSIPFNALLPFICPLLDKDREMQIRSSYDRLRKNEISKQEFLMAVRNIVGERMLRLATQKYMQQERQVQAQVQPARNLQTSPGQFQLQSQAPPQQPTMPSSSSQQLVDAKPVSQLHQSTQHQREAGSRVQPSHMKASTVENKDACLQTPENSGNKPLETDCKSDLQVSEKPTSAGMIAANREMEPSVVSVPTGTKQQQQEQPFPHSPVPWYMDEAVSVASASSNSPTRGSQKRQVPHHQGSALKQLGATEPNNHNNVPRYELRSTTNETKKSLSPFGAPQFGRVNAALDTSKDDALEKESARMSISTAANMIATHQVSSPVSRQAEHMIQMRSQNLSATTTVGTGTNMRTTINRPLVGQKKPLEVLGTLSPQPSKKQKVSGASPDESIEHLNDVTAVSGVNLREEEEQLLSAPKDESLASEGTRRVVREEEDRILLQKAPLQKKISEITSKCGIKNMRNDVERCLSMCVEERMRGLIRNLIRLSKQRVDVEKPRHMVFVTSDVRRQILMMNKKAKEEWDKKQAEEAEKLRKNSENEGSTDADIDKDKDEGRLKALKANKEDDKMRTTAANVAARAAVGGDDMLSKWQLMAEQARKKREGGPDGASGAQLGKDPTRRPVSIYGRTTRDNQEAESRDPTFTSATTFGTIRKFGWNQPAVPQVKSVRTVSVKDVIAVLEREPQMARSTLIYRLYERMRADAAVE